MSQLSYYDELLRTIAKGEKRSEGQWNLLLREALRELDSMVDKEGTTYDSNLMLSFQEYQARLNKVARDRLGITIGPPQLPRIFVDEKR